MSGLLKFGLVLFIGWLIIRYIKLRFIAFMQNAAQQGGRANSKIAEMAKDPVCGSFVPVSQAVTLERDGQNYYFCSDKCLNEYKNR